MIDDIKFTAALNRFYTKDNLYNIYEEYLIDLIADGLIGKDYSIVKLSLVNIDTDKDFFINLLKEVYSKDLFPIFIDKLDKNIKDIFLSILWGEDYELSKTEVNQVFLDKSSYKDENINPKYSFFKFSRKSLNKVYIDIDYDIKRVLRLYLLEKYDKFHLREFKKVNSTFNANNENEFISNVGKYQELFNQGKIMISGTGKVLKDSKKNIKKFCGITEYYENIKNLDLLKSEIVCIFLLLMNLTTREKDYFSSKNMKNIALDFMMGNFVSEENNFPFSNFVLSYLKGIKNIWGNKENTRKTFLSIFNLLKEIEPDSFFSVDDIIEKFIYRDVDTDIIDSEYVMDYIYINEANYERSRIDSYYKYINYIIKPMIKGYLFILSTIGVFEAYYDMPEGSKKLYLKSDFLTAYDGLKYIKLTNFGLFVFDKINSYTFSSKFIKTEIQLDEKLLIVTILGESPTKRMFLESIAQKIGSNLYKITSDSFLKRVKNIRDFNERLSEFKTNISGEDLPENWTIFFENLHEKLNSIKVADDYIILKLSDNKELISIVSRDKRIKEISLKAEGYHLLVKKENYDELYKIFKDYGYYI